MKRTLTGIAAAAVTLGAIAPMAFAATSTSTGLTKANPLPIVVNGSAISTPYEMTGKDSGNTTGFFPIYYFNQALSKIGFTATWDGVTHTWAITAPGVTAAPVAGGVGTGNTTVTVNGTTVKKFNTQAAKDPAGGPVTTYLPIYYINNVLSALGVKGNFSGQTGLSIQQATQGVGNLSNLTVTGASVGDGSLANPATSLNGAAVTFATTLTDANGNPVTNTQVNFNIKLNGFSAPQSVVSGSNTLSATSSNGVNTYTAYTDSTGTAKITVTGPSGSTVAYGVTASAPYKGSNGIAVSTPTSNVEFVANGQAGISPLGTSSSPYVGTLGTAVPVTVTLPTVNGTAQANVQVQLSLAGTGAYFTNSNGANLGQTQTVYTNAAGQAQTWVNDATAGQNITVSATAVGQTATIPSTVIQFQQAGIASKVKNVVVSNNSAQAGQNVTVTGQVVDAAGNAVANAQLLVSSASGQGSYVSGTTTTAFPNVTVAQGVPANSTYGEAITTDANGNFSYTVTDSKVRTDSVSLWAVQNGVVASNSALDVESIGFATPTALSSIVAAGSLGGLSSALSNQTTTVSGLQAAGGLTATAFFEPSTAAKTEIVNSSETYQLSVDNSGSIASINGVDLPNQVSALTLSVNYINGSYSISVPGEPGITIPANPTAPANVNGLTAPAFAIGVTNTNPGATNLTVTNGSISSKATFNFGSGAASSIANVSPVAGSVQPGQSSTWSFQVQDANGNAVTNTAVNVSTDASSETTKAGFWITQVNGTNLSENATVNSSSQSVSTPIPLFTVAAGTTAPASDNLGYGLVNVPGVVSWSGGDTFTVYTDSKGNVSLTLAAGNVPYYSTAAAAGAGVISSNGITAIGNPTDSTISESLGYSGAFNVNLDATASASNEQGTLSVAQPGGTLSKASVSFADASNNAITSTTAGTAIKVNGTVTDAYGNSVSSGTLDVTGAGVTGTTAQGAVNPDGTFSIAFTPTTAGAQTITVKDEATGKTLGTATLTVNAGAAMSAGVKSASPSTLSIGAYGSKAQTVSNVTAGSVYQLTLSAFDAYGNPVTSAPSLKIAFTDNSTGSSLALSDGTSVTTATPITFDANGQATVTYTSSATFSAGTPDTITLTQATGGATADVITLQ